jgi:glycosyltransferase involved in cell wall biosynthesis
MSASARPLRILTVLDHGAVGGGTVVAIGQLREWRSAGVIATSVSLAWTKPAMMTELEPRYHTEFDRRGHLAKIRALRRHIATRPEPPDIVFAIGEYSGIIAVLVRHLLQRARRPIVIVAEHQPSLLEDLLGRRLAAGPGHVLRRLLRGLRHEVDGWICVTSEQFGSRLTAGLLPVDRSVVIANPLLVPAAPDALLEARTERLLRNDAVHLISVGELILGKNHRLLLQALAELEDRFRLTLVGDGIEMEPLREQAARLEITDRVEFVGASRDVADLLDAADIFVLSSDYESFGLVLIEAVARGLPVVATDCGPGVTQLAGSCSAFAVTPVGDASSLARSVQRLSRAHHSVEALRADADRVAAAHDGRRAASEHLSFFGRVLDERRRPRA